MRRLPPWRLLSIALIAFGIMASIAHAQNSGAAYTLRVDGLACPFCAYGIEKRLNAIDGVTAVTIDIASGTVTVIMRAGETLDETTAAKAVAAAGFTMRSFSPKDSRE